MAPGAAEVWFDNSNGHLVAPTDDPGPPYLPNLRMLAEATGGSG